MIASPNWLARLYWGGHLIWVGGLAALVLSWAAWLVVAEQTGDWRHAWRVSTTVNTAGLLVSFVGLWLFTTAARYRAGPRHTRLRWFVRGSAGLLVVLLVWRTLARWRVVSYLLYWPNMSALEEFLVTSGRALLLVVMLIALGWFVRQVALHFRQRWVARGAVVTALAIATAQAAFAILPDITIWLASVYPEGRLPGLPREPRVESVMASIWQAMQVLSMVGYLAGALLLFILARQIRRSLRLSRGLRRFLAISGDSGTLRGDSRA
jgi:hypothetical protein